jgi:hypothetical protein
MPGDAAVDPNLASASEHYRSVRQALGTDDCVGLDDVSNLIAVRRLLLAPDDPAVCGPPRSNATACTANEPRCRFHGCCSARPLSDTIGHPGRSATWTGSSELNVVRASDANVGGAVRGRSL